MKQCISGLTDPIYLCVITTQNELCNLSEDKATCSLCLFSLQHLGKSDLFAVT